MGPTEIEALALRASVAGARVARLATINAAGGADLVPVTYALVEPDVLVTAVDHKPKSTTALRRLDNIRARPDVTLLVDHYDEDWNALWWVRVRGRALVVAPGTADHVRAVAALVDKYEQYRDQPPTGHAIFVEAAEWRGWAGRAGGSGGPPRR